MILTTDGKCLTSHGVGRMMLSITKKELVKFDALVVDSKLLDFDFLLGIDLIKTLGRVHINGQGHAHFSENGPTAYATMKLEEPDFLTEFDKNARIWTTL